MIDAESTPSPSRLCSTLGIRCAAVNASAAYPVPKKWPTARSRTNPVTLDRRIPAPTRADPPPPRRRRVTGSCGCAVMTRPPYRTPEAERGVHAAADSPAGPSDPSAAWPAVVLAVARRSPAGGRGRAAGVAEPLGGGPQSSEAADSGESADTAEGGLSADTGAGAGGGSGAGLSKGESPGLSADSGEGSTQPGSPGLSLGESAESAAELAGLSAVAGQPRSCTRWDPVASDTTTAATR